MEQFGIVCSLRDVFGFLQPLAVSATGALAEEQVYFPEREINPPRELKVGDEVLYGARITPKGPQAVNVRAVDQANKVQSAVLRGNVTRECDMNRNIPGVIELAQESGSSMNQFVIYTAEDCMGGGGGVKAHNARVLLPRKGDEVEFITLSIPNTSYARAQSIKCVKSAREKQMSEQVKRMMESGAQREQGIIETVKFGENFGFIKPADRTGHIYFRFEDLTDQESRENIKESMEVEFFVIADNNKGKMTDRAVHLKVLPPGTVVLESTVAVKASGMVIVEPRTSPREEPGIVLLDAPICREGLPDIEKVELWARCVPEGLLFRVGDRLELDVQNYRPEKINFARSVRVVSFRKLGREVGRVLSLKKDQAFKFGFLRSSQRKNDIYFRQCEVLGPSGTEFVPEANVTLNLGISFETVPDDNRSGTGPRVKAVRCRLLSDSPHVTSLSQLEGGLARVGISAAGAACEGLTLLRKGCTGVIVRDSNKRDAPGLIRPLNFGSPADEVGDSAPDVELLMYRAELIEAVDEFCAAPAWKEVLSDGLSAAKRRALHALLDDLYPGIAHETIVPTGLKTGGAKKFKMWKLQSAEYEAWKSARGQQKPEEDEDDQSPVSSPRISSTSDEAEGVMFVRSDSSDVYGTLTKDLTVTYDVYFDPVTNNRVAKNVKLTDESIPGVEGEHFGVLDSVFSRGGRYGFIRVAPNDEKLFWHNTGISSGMDENTFTEGAEVGFSIRRRGGLRIAVNLRIVSSGETRAVETRLAGLCTGLVVEERGELAVFIIDVSQVPLLTRKFWNTERVKDLVAGSGGGIGGSTATDDETSQATSNNNSGAAPDANYYPPMPRSAVPIDPAELETAKATLAPGDLVQCTCVCNWIRQRTPVKVCSLVKLPTNNLGPRRKGTVVRVKVPLFRHRGSSNASGEGIELSEIRDTEQQGGSAFYCEWHEIRPFFESSKDIVVEGEEVEFYAFPSIGLALHTQVVPKMQEVNGVS